MADLHKAEAAAREALANKDAPIPKYGSLSAASSCVDALRDLLAALDAARGEAVAWADDDEIRLSREYGGSFNAWLSKYPGNDTPLYAAPPAAADRVALARSWNAGYEAARAELAAPPAALAVQADAATRAEGLHAAIDSASELATNAPDDRYRRRAEQVLRFLRAQQPAAAVPAVEDIARVILGAVGGNPRIGEVPATYMRAAEQVRAMLAAERKGE